MLNSTKYQNRLNLTLFIIIIVYSVTTNPATATFPTPSKYFHAIELAGQSKYSDAIEYLKQNIHEDSSFVPAYLRIAEFYRYDKKLIDGQTYFQNAINQFAENPNFYIGLALLAKWSNDWKSTFENCKSFLEKGGTSPEALDLMVESALHLNQTNHLTKIFRKLQRNKSQKFLNDLGYAIWRYRISNYKKAKTTILKYLKKNKDDWYGYYLLGKISQQMKNYNMVFSSFHKALQLIGQSDSYKKLPIFRTFGICYQEVGKADSAAYFLDQATLLAQKLGALEEQIKISQARSIFYKKEGYYQKMADDCLRGIRFAKQIEEDISLASLYYNLAFAYAKMSDRNNALKYYFQSLEYATTLHDLELISKTYAEVGRQYMNLEAWEKALEYLNKSMSVAQKARLSNLKHFALLNIADVHKFQGQIEQAKHAYEKVLRYAQKTRQNSLIETCYLKLANLYLKPSSNLNNARYYLSLADALARKNINIQYSANHRWMQGKISLIEGNLENAEVLFLDAVELGQKIGAYVPILAGKAGLISTYLNAQCLDMATMQADTALDYMNKFGNLYFSEISSEFFDLKKELFSPAANAFLNVGNISRIYEICEQNKAQNHIRNISQIRFKIKTSVPDSIKWKLDKINERLKNKWSKLWELWKRDAADNLDEVLKTTNEIKHLKSTQETVKLEITQKYPNYFNLIYPSYEPLSKLREVLRKNDGIFIHYFVGENSTIILLVRPDSMFYKRIDISREQLERLIDQMSPLFSARKSDFKDTIDKKEVAFHLDIAGQLYQIIFEPIKDWIPPQSNIIISADDVLNRFPYECLVTNHIELADNYDYEHAKFLVEDYAISYVPYAQLLDYPYIHKKRSKKTFLAFTNNPQEEMKLFASAIGLKEAQVYSREITSKERFLKEFTDYQIIHLAIPTILDDRQPIYSKLFFSNPTNTADYLEIHELFNFELSADLVVLSACENEPSRLKNGEALKTLAHGFIYTGVSSILANLWNISVEKSSDLLVDFYANLKLGMSKSAALQQAKINYLQKGNRHPYYWAPYILMGNPESIKLQSKNVNYLSLFALIGMFLFVLYVFWQFQQVKNNVDKTKLQG